MDKLSVIIPVKEPEPYLHTLEDHLSQVLAPRIRFEVLEQREAGLTNAIVQGVKRAEGDTIVVMDADGSHDPKYLPSMLEASESSDLVVAYKQVDRTSFYRRLISSLYRTLARRLLGLDIHDPMSGFVLGRRQLFESLEPSDDYKFLLQLLVKNRCTIAEVPITFLPRQAGRSKANLVTGIRTVYSILQLSRRIQ